VQRSSWSAPESKRTPSFATGTDPAAAKSKAAAKRNSFPRQLLISTNREKILSLGHQWIGKDPCSETKNQQAVESISNLNFLALLTGINTTARLYKQLVSMGPSSFDNPSMESKDVIFMDDYSSSILRSCATTTVAHVLVGLGLAKLFKGQQFKGWPLYTYWHSIFHTGFVLPLFLSFFAVTIKDPKRWLEGDNKRQSDELGAEQWVQTTNIGFQVAITILSFRKVIKSPALMLHHVITILGCLALLHPRHCAGYGASFTAFTEFGSTFHNIMSLEGGKTTRLLRVVTDILTRGGGLFLIGSEFPIARSRGLPLYLQVWSWLGGLAWFGINAQWTVQVCVGLLKKRKLKT